MIFTINIGLYLLISSLVENTVKTEVVNVSELFNARNTFTSQKNLSGFDESNCFNTGRARSGEVPWYRYWEIIDDAAAVFKGCEGVLHCYRKRLLQGLDRAIDSDSITIADGVFLMKDFEEENSSFQDPREAEEEPLLVALARRMIRLLQTHSLRVRLGVMKEDPGQARVGHGYRQAFPLMVGSFMLMASFLVPMGFQFLAVVGGKALILSQIALVMAMGGSLQRYFGFRGANYPQAPAPVPAPYGGIVQHEYLVNREDAQPQPWHRAMQGEEVVGVRERPPTSGQLTSQQLVGFMHQLPPSTAKKV